MKVPKIVFGTGTVLLLAIAIWMQVTHFTSHGGWVRGGGWHKDTMTAGGVFFFAAVFAGMYVTVVFVERKQKAEDDKPSQRNYYN